MGLWPKSIIANKKKEYKRYGQDPPLLTNCNPLEIMWKTQNTTLSEQFQTPIAKS